jgi:hypothetical protein
LTSVACPARTFCAATGTLGRLYTSTDPSDPGSWTTTRLGEYVESVTCSSPTWCTVGAAGPTVMYSTEPGAGASAWSTAARLTGRGLACPEPEFCAELADYDEVLASDDPLGGAGNWVTTDMQLPDERLGPGFLDALSCPSAELCVTGGSSGTVYASADPTAGRSSWISAFVGEPNPYSNGSPSIAGIDCPQPSFCAATTWGGTIATTTTPLGGKGAWTVSRNPDAYFLGPISCAVDGSLCASIDQNGNAITSSSPQDEVSDWGNLEPIYDGEGLRDVSCAVDGSLCGVISRDGEVIVGSRLPDPSGGEEAAGGEGSPAKGEGSASAGSPDQPPAPPGPAPFSCRKPKPHKAKRGPAIGRRHQVSNGGKRSRSRCSRHA